MILVDAPAFRPPGATDAEWLEVMRRLYPGQLFVQTEAERAGWLKKLRLEPTLSKLQVVTTPEGMLFWSLLPESIEVESHHGKKLTKAMRRPDIKSWHEAVAVGSHLKTQVRKQLRAPGVLERSEQLAREYEAAGIPEGKIGDEGGRYFLVDRDSYQGVREMLFDHITAGGWWSWDTETETSGEEDSEALNPYTAQLVSFSISVQPGEAWHFPIAHRNEDGTPWPGNVPGAFETITRAMALTWAYPFGLGPAFTPYDRKRVVLWNAKYDLSVACNPVNAAVDAQTVYERWLPLVQDGMLMAAVANQPRAGLKWNAQAELGEETVDYQRLTGGKSFAFVPPEKARVYAGKDADWTLRLFPILSRKLDELSLRSYGVYEGELGLIEYFMRMERRGMRLDREVLSSALDELEERVAWMERLFRISMGAAGVQLPDELNLGSKDQVAELFYAPPPRGLGLPVLQRTTSGARGSVDKKSWNKLRASGFDLAPIRIYRSYVEARQDLDHYFKPVPQFIQSDGRVRPSFMQVGARSGRSTATKPPVQTFPESLRKAVVAEEGGELGAIDWEQMELRWMALVYGEEAMLRVFRSGGDIHRDTQTRVGLPDRVRAKNFNFGAGYGAGAETLADVGGIPIDQAKSFLEAYWRSYPTLRGGMDGAIREARETGRTVTWKGRVRLLPAAYNDELQAENDRLAMNHPIQGGCRDIAGDAMFRLLPLVRLGEQCDIWPINFMHDEFDFERGPGAGDLEWQAFLREAAEIMEGANPRPEVVPLPVKTTVGKSWAECK